MTEIDPLAGANRLGSAIGGDTVAFVDYGSGTHLGDIVAEKLTDNTREVVSVAGNVSQQNPNVAPDSSAIVWERCTPLLVCDVLKAARTLGIWIVSPVASSPGNESNPDTDGAWIVYGGDRAANLTGPDIYLQPLAGGSETQLAIPGWQLNPSISRGVVAFESIAAGSGTSDLFVYDIATNLLYQVTSTPGLNESLNDISVLDNGDVRVVWAADDGPGGERNVYGTTFSLLPPPTLTVAPVIGETRRQAIITATLTSNGTPIAGQRVRFRLNGGPFLRDDAITDANGIASVIATLDFPPGFYPGGVEALFEGNLELRLGSVIATADLTVTKAATSLTLSAAPNPSALGQPVTLTATVEARLFPPPGTIDFSYRLGTTTTPIGSAGIDPLTGIATIVAASLPLGALELVASYAENADYLGSIATVGHAVGRTQTVLVLASSRNPSLTTAPPTFYAQFEGLAAGQAPTGKVEFFVDRTLLCRSTVYTLGGVRTQASCGGASLPVGSHSIKAVYLGDATFASSTATAITQRVFEGSYDMVFLGTAGEAMAISNSGHVIGNTPVDASNSSSAFLYDPNGVLQLLPTLGGTRATATDVNDAGEVVGSSRLAGDGSVHAFRFANGQMFDLGTLGGQNSFATAIDSNGTIVGVAETPTSGHAFRTVRGGLQDLGTLGGLSSTAFAISESGVIAGGAAVQNGSQHAALFAPVLTDLGTLGGATSTALAVNSAGETAGVSDNLSGAQRAFVHRDGTMRDVAAGLQHTSSVAAAINDSGDAAGWFEAVDPATGETLTHAFRYGLDGLTHLAVGTASAVNNAGQTVGTAGVPARSVGFVHNGVSLLPLHESDSGIGPVLITSTARDINDSGQIVGSLSGRAVLWNPVPASRLTVHPAVGLRNASTVLSATLLDTFGGAAVGKDVYFSLNAQPIGHATTGLDGTARVSLSLQGIAAGTYIGIVTAAFGGDSTLGPSSAAGNLTVIAQAVVVPATAGIAEPIVTINNFPGHQYDPHVSGDLVSYTDGLAPSAIRYFRFSTTTDAQIPLQGSLTDVLSDVSEERIVFSRALSDRNSIVVFDGRTTALSEVAPQTGSNRLGSGIGGNIVAFVDYNRGTALGDIVAWDLSTTTPTVLSVSAQAEQNPNVSPDGLAVVWEECATLNDCNVFKAVRSGGDWAVSPAANTPDAENNPDTDGTWIVYDAHRSGSPTGPDIYLQPLAGGPEIQLAIPGMQTNPSISRGFISFDSAMPGALSDLFVYDIASNVLYQITSTPDVSETLSDISVLDNGDVRVVWNANDGPSGERNVYGTTLHLSPLARVIAGANVTVQPTDLQGALQPITVTFSEVQSAGVVFATPMSSLPPLPSGFVLNGTAYDIQTTAEYVPPVTICFQGTFTAQDRLLHYEGGTWVDVTTTQTATQICGSVSTLSPFAVATMVNTPPSLTLPPDITREATGPSGASVSYSVSATDGEDGVLVPACSPVSGTVFPLGTITVSCSATDSAGAVASGTFTVTVRDTTPPAVTPPSAITIPATEAGSARGSSWPALAAFLAAGSAIDLVDAAPARLAPQVAGLDAGSTTLFPLGTTTPVTFRFRDASGNIGVATSTVTVILGTPAISIRIAASGTVTGGQRFVDLEVSNTGSGNARQLSVDLILPVVTRGGGIPKLVSPSVPLSLGALDVGGKVTVRVVIDVPNGAKELLITEAGRFTNVLGGPGGYLEAQKFVP